MKAHWRRLLAYRPKLKRAQLQLRNCARRARDSPTARVWYGRPGWWPPEP